MYRNVKEPASTHKTYKLSPAFGLHHLKGRKLFLTFTSQWTNSSIFLFSSPVKTVLPTSRNLGLSLKTPHLSSIYMFKELKTFGCTFVSCSNCALSSGCSDSSAFVAVGQQTGDSASESHTYWTWRKKMMKNGHIGLNIYYNWINYQCKVLFDRLMDTF